MHQLRERCRYEETEQESSRCHPDSTAEEQRPHLTRLRAEGHSNADFTASLPHGVGDDAIDTAEPEQQCHRRSGHEQDERKPGTRHRPVVECIQRGRLRKRQRRIHRGHRLTQRLKQTAGAGEVRADHKTDAARLVGSKDFGVHSRGPIHSRWRLLKYAIVIHIRCDADHLAPWAGSAVELPDPLPYRRLSRSPILPREALGHDRHVVQRIQISPGEVAAGDERRPESLKRSWRDELHLTVRRRLLAIVGLAVD